MYCQDVLGCTGAGYFLSFVAWSFQEMEEGAQETMIDNEVELLYTWLMMLLTFTHSTSKKKVSWGFSSSILQSL
jgi:hypothetical protein